MTPRTYNGTHASLFFAGRTSEEVSELKRRLADKALELGYASNSANMKGTGSVSALLEAIASGDVLLNRKPRPVGRPPKSPKEGA